MHMTDCIIPSHMRDNIDGYKLVKWAKKNTRLHRLMWFFSYGEIPEGMVVGHKCNNKGCVNVQHLYLTTFKQNSTDAKNDGLYRVLNNHGRRALTDEQVLEAHKLYNKDKITQAKLAEMYGVKFGTMSQILRGVSYNNLFLKYRANGE